MATTESTSADPAVYSAYHSLLRSPRFSLINSGAKSRVISLVGKAKCGKTTVIQSLVKEALGAGWETLYYNTQNNVSEIVSGLSLLISRKTDISSNNRSILLVLDDVSSFCPELIMLLINWHGDSKLKSHITIVFTTLPDRMDLLKMSDFIFLFPLHSAENRDERYSGAWDILVEAKVMSGLFSREEDGVQYTPMEYQHRTLSDLTRAVSCCDERAVPVFGRYSSYFYSADKQQEEGK
jgi:hypothetical protein